MNNYDILVEKIEKAMGEFNRRMEGVTACLNVFRVNVKELLREMPINDKEEDAIRILKYPIRHYQIIIMSIKNSVEIIFEHSEDLRNACHACTENGMCGFGRCPIYIEHFDGECVVQSLLFDIDRLKKAGLEEFPKRLETYLEEIEMWRGRNSES